MDRYQGLICPLTRLPLTYSTIQEARLAIAGGRELGVRLATRKSAAPIGETDFVMLREDGKAAFPILDEFPVLMAPEVLTHPDFRVTFDLDGSHYAEAYNESEFYNQIATDRASKIRATDSIMHIDDESVQHLGRVAGYSPSERASFPEPMVRWLSARMDLGSEVDCFQHLGSVRNLDVVQIGGGGIAAVRFLLAGARSATLLTPMTGEARFARELARHLGVFCKIRCVIAIAEEIPCASCSFDRAYSGGCVHHMTTEKALPEIARVLREGGKFAAAEPWRAPLYSVGTAMFGKREANAFCRPLTRKRVEPLYSSFSAAQAVHHGTFTRYPMLALEKLGVRVPLRVALSIGKIDDQLCGFLPGLRHLGSGIALLGTK